MNAIVDPEYVDLLALDLTTLGIEIEQSKAAIGGDIRRQAVDDVFKKACARLATYIDQRDSLAIRVVAIAKRYGALCPQGKRVLVGKDWVIQEREGGLTIIACVQPEDAKQHAATDPQKPKVTAEDQRFLRGLRIDPQL